MGRFSLIEAGSARYSLAGDLLAKFPNVHAEPTVLREALGSERYVERLFKLD